MAVIKCKMCGGDLRIEEGTTVCECEYCGTRQTVPSADSEKKLTLFSRAGRLLRGCEFDKASGVFETIVADFPEEAEAYWGLVLCKYGIEYVDDPATGKKVPTCHRSSFESVLDDPNFEQACENTDAVARRVYRNEARQIEDLRQAILQVSGKEEPYDVFISYKETDENGDRTLDSVIAQDIYKELTGEGYRVFFSRISLEDKLGTEYEPYIFAALNSAKVMLVVGTDYENFDSVWVKNEWSRFLKLIAAGQKKTLIPVFKNMDAYDMPKEFAKLAAQDMGKVGAMQDLVRGVEKIVGQKKPETVKETVVVQQGGGPNVSALLKRGDLALESREWDKAKGYFDNALNMDAESAEAYLGLFFVEHQCRNESDYIRQACSGKPEQDKIVLNGNRKHIDEVVKRCCVPGWLEENTVRRLYSYDATVLSSARGQKNLLEQEWKKIQQDHNLGLAFRFAKGSIKDRLDRFQQDLDAGLKENVARAVKNDNAAKERKQQAYMEFLNGADQKAERLHADAVKRRKAVYQDAVSNAESAETAEELRKVVETLQKGFSRDKEAAALAAKCKEKIKSLEQAAAEEAQRQQALAEKATKEKKARNTKVGIVSGVVAAVVITVIMVVTRVVIPNNQYKAAEALLAAGQYEEAISAFEALNGYKDSAERPLQIQYTIAEQLLESGKAQEALAAFEDIRGYKDSDAKIKEITASILDQGVAEAEALMAAGEYDKAIEAFTKLEDYTSSGEMIKECQYRKASALAEAGQYDDAMAIVRDLAEYKDCADKFVALWKTKFGSAAVGEIVFLGEYEQDNDNANGKEKIEWQVLAKEAGRILVISRYGLDCKAFDLGGTDADWNSCSLREWMSKDFLNNAFNLTEQSMIQTSTVKADKNPEYTTNPGPDTKDKVFLLSIPEVGKYFPTDEERQCRPTAYVKAQNGNISSERGTCNWWLRTPGCSLSFCTVVSRNDGSVGANALNKYINAVRPAMWIELAS